MIPRLVRLLLERVVSCSRTYRVYTKTAAQRRGTRDDQVRIYDAASPPPATVRARYAACVGRLSAWLMFRRLRRHGAVMLALVGDDGLIAYGWIQTWKPLRRQLWWLADDAICLGPYWTHPDHRGRGIYGRLLDHSLDECDRRGFDEVYVWADHDNRSSLRAIEKAGFQPVGTYRVTTRLLGMVRRHQRVAP